MECTRERANAAADKVKVKAWLDMADGLTHVAEVTSFVSKAAVFDAHCFRNAAGTFGYVAVVDADGTVRSVGSVSSVDQFDGPRVDYTLHETQPIP